MICIWLYMHIINGYKWHWPPNSDRLHSLASGHCHLRIWQDLPFPFCFFPFRGSNCIFSHWCSGQESPLIDRLLLVSLRTAAKVASMCGPPTHASCLPGWARLAIPGGNPPREVGESVSFLPCNFLTRPLKGAVWFWYSTEPWTWPASNGIGRVIGFHLWRAGSSWLTPLWPGADATAKCYPRVIFGRELLRTGPPSRTVVQKPLIYVYHIYI